MGELICRKGSQTACYLPLGHLCPPPPPSLVSSVPLTTSNTYTLLSAVCPSSPRMLISRVTSRRGNIKPPLGRTEKPTPWGHSVGPIYFQGEPGPGGPPSACSCQQGLPLADRCLGGLQVQAKNLVLEPIGAPSILLDPREQAIGTWQCCVQRKRGCRVKAGQLGGAQ